MSNMRPRLKFGIVVGEVSGDALGAKLIPALNARFSSYGLEFIGTAGPLLQKQGMSSFFPLADIAVMGIVPVIKRLPSLMKRIHETAERLIAAKIDCLIIIDSPDFTHRVARKVKAALPTIPIIDYVSPSVWAWRPGRAKDMRAYIDHVLALLPFEPVAHQTLCGPPCTYVGHPLIERKSLFVPSVDEEARRSSEPPILLVLPGSRRSEITRLMPIFGETVARIKHIHGRDFDLILPAVDHLREEIETAAKSWAIKPRIIHGEAAKYHAFRKAYAALAASGTVTLELALAHVPMAVGYRVGAIEGQIRHFINVSSVVLANLIIGENVVPERIQGACNAEQLSADLLPLLSNTEERRQQLRGFDRLDHLMAIEEGSPSIKAADVIARYIA
ncbi:MAG: lipid-A-disaccharide synthase [Alphaproteobacteria bacterium]|nr:lipid-A-disaccharide synthase [Alphaproteobacteria bacterium]